ncbi:MAG: PilZ domain-containing protein [Pseudomonadales bacterium]
MSADKSKNDQAESSVAATAAQGSTQEGATDLVTERRTFPRVEIPMLVELQHPTIPSSRCIVENISESGVFVGVEAINLSVGADVKLKVLNTSAVELEPTPTVAMKVVRVTNTGLGMTFSNKSARHLWHTAERRRRALTVGLDYFQIHINLVTMCGARMLLLSQRGRWVLPNFYLTVGQDWHSAAREHLQETIGSVDMDFAQILAIDSLLVPDLPQTATLSLYQRVDIADSKISIAPDAGYTEYRWIKQARKLKELTITSADTGILLEQLFKPDGNAT